MGLREVFKYGSRPVSPATPETVSPPHRFAGRESPKFQIAGAHAIVMECPECGQRSATYDYSQGDSHIFTCKAGMTIHYQKVWNPSTRRAEKKRDATGKPLKRYIQPCRGRIEV